jgi:hypothetical protein
MMDVRKKHVISVTFTANTWQNRFFLSFVISSVRSDRVSGRRFAEKGCDSNFRFKDWCFLHLLVFAGI